MGHKTREELAAAEVSCEKAESVLRARYFTTCREYAEEIETTVREAIAAGELERDDVSGRVCELLDETCDNSEWIIYTWRNFEVLRWSDHHDAYVEEFGEEGVCRDGCINWAALAYAAMRADVAEYVDADALSAEPEEPKVAP
jgi:hypothetical protein